MLEQKSNSRPLLRLSDTGHYLSLWVILSLYILVSNPVFAEEPKQLFVVRDVTAEYVYLQGGRSDGLAIGDRFVIKKNDSTIVELELVYLSDRSASCKIISATSAIVTGLKAILITIHAGNDTTKTTPVDTLPIAAAERKPPSLQAIAPRVKPVISGSVSLTYDNWIDKANERLNFSQSTVRLSVRARKIAGKDLTFSIRSRGRYDHRSRALSYGVPQKDWANRIYELSLSYDDPKAPISISGGRIPVRRIGSAGYIDGMMIEYHLYGPVRTGVYAGAQPNWQYTEGGLSAQKYGFYFNYMRGNYQSARLEMTIAGTSEYHHATTSRELIYSQTSFSLGNRWNISQSSEIDVNRGWRRDRTSRAFSLSSAYIDTRFRFNNRLSAGLSYDNRRNYWTYEQKSLADSLFDDHLSKGIRSRLDIGLPGNFLTGLSVGYRTRGGDPVPTYSYSANVNKSGLVSAHSSLNLQYSGFIGPQQKGSNFSVRIGEYLRQRDYVSLGYGYYRYSSMAGTTARLNHWIESTIWVDLFKNFFLNGMYQYNVGADLSGHRLQIEFGCLL
jgi:hypothetical protein